ncbi:MAG: phosphoribosylanthranilate isomerase [Planctomycetota bacterium]|nr:phosphoribosylanthranilate isomerase [Planctomycetota bacterium]
MKVRVKICGVTTLDDARAVLEAGADALGLNFVPSSPRCLKDAALARSIAELARGRGALAVGVFANETPDAMLRTAEAAGLDVLQLHGDEPAALAADLRARSAVKLWKAARIATRADLDRVAAEAWPCDLLLLDARVPGHLGGTGQTFDWSILDGFARTRPLALAGGLNPANVAEAVRRVRPDWVDTASGVEASPGRKDAARTREFVESARAASV